MEASSVGRSLMCRCPLLFFLPRDPHAVPHPGGTRVFADLRTGPQEGVASTRILLPATPSYLKMRLLLLAFPAYSLTASHNFALQVFLFVFSPLLLRKSEAH